MSPPPTSIDGTDITGATIDGHEVQEITIDGQVVFTAVQGPDTSMFQSPIYQFFPNSAGFTDGQSPVPYPEVLAGLPDATAVDNPSYDADFNGLGLIDYDGNDGHNWTSDGQLPTASDSQVSIFVLYFTTTNSSFQRLSGYSTAGPSLSSDGAYRFQNGPSFDVFGGSYPTNQLDTTGVTYDAATDAVEVYGGGASAPVATGSSVWSLQDTNRGHGYEASNNGLFLSGGIGEIVYCNTVESGTAYANFHSDRLG